MTNNHNDEPMLYGIRQGDRFEFLGLREKGKDFLDHPHRTPGEIARFITILGINEAGELQCRVDPIMNSEEFRAWVKGAFRTSESAIISVPIERVDRLLAERIWVKLNS